MEGGAVLSPGPGPPDATAPAVPPARYGRLPRRLGGGPARNLGYGTRCDAGNASRTRARHVDPNLRILSSCRSDSAATCSRDR